MKKSRKKIINRLKPLIGKEIIRIRATQSGNEVYTSSPVLLVGFSADGRLIIKDPNGFVTYEQSTLSIDFTDFMWISYEQAIKPKNNSLNQWRGKYIRRITPVKLSPVLKDTSYTRDAVQLISATKHHIFFEHIDSSQFVYPIILNYRWNKLEDWELAE